MEGWELEMRLGCWLAPMVKGLEAQEPGQDPESSREPAVVGGEG